MFFRASLIRWSLTGSSIAMAMRPPDAPMFPEPVSRRVIGDVVISCEEYVGINNAPILATPYSIFEGLFPVYLKTHEKNSKVKFLETLIASYEILVPVNKRETYKNICCNKISFIEAEYKNNFCGRTSIIHGDLTPRNAANARDEFKYFDLEFNRFRK